ncbi:ABC-type transport system, periplasmic component [Halapricum desulfuricans]|uniref:ABC-type transport system, periplasmic component n=1 Tax=Halapricum desulfuricans TaxID=2841257 RepID=A0A897NI40_9EURY|nr:ABC transporter substrate-binding protein [Halapricum desulfuricans]QSG10633.1 ABC-type transport system, periplasmic component [Halapricum desulfuricans]
MPEKTTRRGFLTAAGGGAAAALAGCSSGPSDDGSTPTETGGAPSYGGDGDTASEQTDTDEEETPAEPGGTLQMMASGSIQTLDPINAKGSGAGYDQYGRSLMEFKDGLYPPEAELATDYTVSEDGLTYTFDLREDVTFHDGSELTAHDIVYSYRRLAGSENSRNRDDIIGETMTIAHEKDPSRTEPTDETTLSDYVPGSLAVEAVDDYTFRFELESPFQYTLFQIAGGAFAVLPENAVGDVEGYDGEYSYNEFFSTENGGPTYAGLGPFEVDSWTKGSQIKLTKFEDYYGDGPLLDGITYTVVGSGQTRLQRFENGNADVLEGMPTASFNPGNVSIEETRGNRSTGTYTFDDGTEVNYGQIPALTTEYLVFNTLEVPIPVRKAFAYAMNQHEIAQNVYKGVAKPAYHITPPAPYPTFEDGVSSVETYDRHAESGYQSVTDYGADGYPYGYGERLVGEATAVMEDAGYGSDDMYSITATTITGDSGYQSVFTRLQPKLRAAHIDMSIEEAEFGTIISRAISGDMEVFALGDGMEYPGPQNFLRFLYGESPSGQFTRWGAEGSYHDADRRQQALDAWEEYYATDDATQATRNRAFQAIEEINWASVQELPTVHPTAQRFWHDYVDVEMYGVMENQTFDDVTLRR